MKLERSFKVGLREIGLKNEITNYGFLAFLQDIATDHSNMIGLGAKDIKTKKVAWLLIDWELNVMKRVPYGEEVLIKTYAVKMEAPSYHVFRNFEVYCKNELIATATSKWVLFDIEKNKIRKIDLEIMNLYNPEGSLDDIKEKIDKLKEPSEYESIYDYQIKRGDLDINNHVNNINYLRIAYEALPEEIFLGEEMNHLRIFYRQQLKMGDKIKCFYKNDKGKHYITVKSENNNIVYSIIVLSQY